MNPQLSFLILPLNLSILSPMASGNSLEGKEKTSQMVNIVVFAPRAYEELLPFEVMNVTGIPNHNIHVTPGTTFFRPLAGANPTLGTIGTIQKQPELKIEFITKSNHLDQLNQRVREVHIFESFVIEIYGNSPELNYQGDMVKVRTQTSPEKTHVVMDELIQCGAGIIGHYDHCFFLYDDPEDGLQHIETICSRESIPTVIEALQNMNTPIEIAEFLQSPSYKGKLWTQRILGTDEACLMLNAFREII